jgi:phosphoribosylanthranilate isomerase
MLLMARRIANLTDARYFAAKEVNYLAFNLTPGTPGYLDPVLMQAMREWVQGPKIVGEFGADTSVDFIREAAAFYRLDAVIVSDSTELAIWDNTEVWHTVKPAAFSEPPLTNITGYIMEWPSFDVPAEWQARSMVQYEGDAADLSAFLQGGQWLGISMAGGEEEQTGVKSFDDIEAIFDCLQTEND